MLITVSFLFTFMLQKWQKTIVRIKCAKQLFAKKCRHTPLHKRCLLYFSLHPEGCLSLLMSDPDKGESPISYHAGQLTLGDGRLYIVPHPHAVLRGTA